MRTKLAAAIAGTAAAVVLAISGQPAQAGEYDATGDLDCNAGYVCDFDYINWGGSGVGYFDDEWDYLGGSVASQFRYMDNRSESWENHGTSTYGNVVFFTINGAPGNAIFRCLKKGYTLGGNIDIDNDVEGHVWKNSCNGYVVL
ncbi:hypothetical protein F4553_003353 [Allocatelliglobosispora scoriae]|uniref:Peptidase inhibitor family I36 n=1 Tax=Allocatelliglobosispora scoriae TaxID=643052 RepID=A0A841BNX7_9ACTN|nr:hypothetical protein [Allocatelliglobosispora scoriae]MBB5869974.1 hypothetical protein [Allocatelliglobosispora scoriae]